MNKNILIIVLLLIYSLGKSQTTEAVNAQFDKEVAITKAQSNLIFEKSKVLPNETQIAIAIIKNGNVNFYGIKRENDSIFSFNNHKSIFEIGSITKVFTGTLLSNFVLEKKIELSSNINDYLNFSLKNDTKISFKQLATHSSGLPRIPTNMEVSEVNPYQKYGEKELKKYLSEDLKLLSSPGEKIEYSNLGVGFLGYILSKIADKTYENLLQTKIFSKYQMGSSTTNRYVIVDRLVKGRNEDGDIVPNWDMSVLMGAGGVLSTVDDLSKFLVAQFNNSNKELELTRRSFFKVNDNYEMGLGWSRIKKKSGAIWNWHNGGTGGYSSSMIMDTKNKNGIIILSNVSAFSKMVDNVTGLSPELMKTLGE